jgi:hypothetical protein
MTHDQACFWVGLSRRQDCAAASKALRLRCLHLPTLVAMTSLLIIFNAFDGQGSRHFLASHAAPL